MSTTIHIAPSAFLKAFDDDTARFAPDGGIDTDDGGPYRLTLDGDRFGYGIDGFPAAPDDGNLILEVPDHGTWLAEVLDVSYSDVWIELT